MRKQLIKVYVDEQTKSKLEDRAGRESLSSFVSGLIDSYFEEYPGLTDEELRRIEANLPKAGDKVNIKKPARFVPSYEGGQMQKIACGHGTKVGYFCLDCGEVVKP